MRSTGQEVAFQDLTWLMVGDSVYNQTRFLEGGIRMSNKPRSMVGRCIWIPALIALCAMLLPAATITVSSPVWGTQEGRNGKSLTIAWSADAALTGQVRIELRDQPSYVTVKTIAASTSNTGHYSWTIPADVSKAIYRVRVTFLSGGSSGQSQMFWIVPWVKFNNPPADTYDTVWHRGDSEAITWSWVGPKTGAEFVDVFLAKTADEASRAMIASHVPNANGYMWKIPADCPLGSFFLSLGESGTGGSYTRTTITVKVASLINFKEPMSTTIKK
jgi:hypothetical protein